MRWKTLSFKIEENLHKILEKICKARGEALSSFVRRAVRMELARLGYLGSEDRKALGLETEETRK